MVCASCGAENRKGARFCDSCGAALAEAAPVRAVRKVVTVLFCDVTGSTALGERIDPESLRHVMARYFETAKTIVERHGGTVEKFIGDAVMAVFGVPTVHEDDALRAVRAADELRGGLDELNDELESSYGTRLELRMGVNTGEVVTGTEERLATGDAVNTAARLEQAAQPGELLLGEETYRLVSAGAEVEHAPPVEAKGKSEPLTAFRLVSVQADAPPRRHEAPMVGRAGQRELLEGTFANAVSERSCALFTILGTAGVGKSRLAQEFLAGVDATVVSGRCLSYGEGISYWPVTAVVKQLVPDEEIVGPLASILGDDEAPSSPEEIAWAFRKLLESCALERPVVVVFDDLHWGEPTFLDLVEHVADLSRDAPILLLCMARPELLDVRPTWGGGKLNASNVLLEPLAAGETAELLDSLGGAIGEELRTRILEAAGGNPLFVEEMVAVAHDGSGDVEVPPTIQALLAARLDQLDTGERGVLERGAVEGQVFHRGAVAALAPAEPRIDGRLLTLVRKDLVRPEPTLLPGDDAYRFRHLLIRDTAYEALSKATRAELHERFATWLEEHGADLVELDEIVAYHLEQAYRYRAELGPLDELAEAIAERAAARLLDAGERARERGDFVAAQALLTRAAELLPEADPTRRLALVEVAAVMGELGAYSEALALLGEVLAAAHAVADERAQARAELVRLDIAALTDPQMTMVGSIAISKACREVLERLGDEEGIVLAERMIGNFSWWTGNTEEADRWWGQALKRAERTKPRLRAELDTWTAFALWIGPTPLTEGLRICDELLREPVGPIRDGSITVLRGALKAMRGDISGARADAAAGRAVLDDLGHEVWGAGTRMVEADIELLAGDPSAAAESLLAGYDVLRGHAATGYLSTIVGMRAEAALELGQEDEARRLCDETLELAAKDDFEPRLRAAAIRALVDARQGDFAVADEGIAEAARLVEPSDFLMMHAFVAMKAAEVARLAGRPEQERKALERALAFSERKGSLVTAAQARERLETLG